MPRPGTCHRKCHGLNGFQIIWSEIEGATGFSLNTVVLRSVIGSPFHKCLP